MTAQVPDHVRIGDRTWDIAAIDGNELFDPADEGITPVASSSANWAGFQCAYAVVGAQFVVEDLWLSSLSTVDGRPIQPGESLLGGTLELLGEWGDDLVLRQLNRPFSFTGRLLVGDGFLDELYEHMGYHPAWKFEEVRELVIDGGRVTRNEDRSERMAAVRGRMLAGGGRGPRPPGGPLNWIEETFSRSYEHSWPE